MFIIIIIRTAIIFNRGSFITPLLVYFDLEIKRLILMVYRVASIYENVSLGCLVTLTGAIKKVHR